MLSPTMLQKLAVTFGRDSASKFADMLNVGAARVATHYSGGDIGEQINNAIADLPDTGGVITIPSGRHVLETAVNYGNKTGVIITGAVPSFGMDYADLPVILDSYVTGAAAITFGVPAASGYPAAGQALLDLQIVQKVASTCPVVHVANSAHGWLRNLSISGNAPGSYDNHAAKGIYLGGPDGTYRGYGWRLENVYINKCDDGLVADGAHNTQLWACQMLGCQRGLVVGENVLSTVFALHGCSLEYNIVGIELAHCDLFSAFGLYMEDVASDVEQDSVLMQIGTSDVCRGGVLCGVYWQVGGGDATHHYALNLQRARKWTIAGGRVMSGIDAFIKNDATDVADIAVIGVDSAASTFIDDTTGIEAVLACGNDGRTMFPNLPTQAGSAGELWNDNGTVKVSAG